MSNGLRTMILRGTAVYLGLSALGGLGMDIRAAFFGTGPEVPVIDGKPFLAIGFTEAHGLALILATLFWRMPSQRFWHGVAAATTLLLGVCNLVFWDIFHVANNLAMGYVFTSLHLAFGLANLAAAFGAARFATAR